MNATDQPSQQADAKPTIVLVHGAFADASSWASSSGCNSRVTPSSRQRIRCEA